MLLQAREDDWVCWLLKEIPKGLVMLKPDVTLARIVTSETGIHLEKSTMIGSEVPPKGTSKVLETKEGVQFVLTTLRSKF